jgi:CheY-like chemotaxis protein
MRARERRNQVSWSVLVVDDEPITRNMLRMILSYAGYVIHEAEDGLDALEKIKAHSPDLVLLDVMMPNMDGIDVCKTVRQNETMQDLPIIMLSARAHAADVEAGLAAGATKYLTKPISRKKLLEEVEDALSKMAVFGE